MKRRCFGALAVHLLKSLETVQQAKAETNSGESGDIGVLSWFQPCRSWAFAQNSTADGHRANELQLSLSGNAEMDPVSIVIWLAIGAISGWLAGLLVKGYGFGLVGNVIVGIVGAFLGGWLFRQFGASAGGGLVGSIVTSVVGGVVLLFLIGLVRKVT